ncbi:MAG TPA: hypothetical protein VLK34_06565 [Nocardioidaceae bacterium]|nr:hypothetical protein [Nocardioidaceae bacterium]
MSSSNQPEDDFEAQLRAALGEHADTAHHVDLADGALSKARGIRRRRVALSTVAVLATVAIAIPVGAQLDGNGDTDHTASEPTTDDGTAPTPRPVVQVALADLPGGDTPQVPYIAGATFVDASGTVHPADAAEGTVITDAAALQDGTLLWQQDVGNADSLTVKVSGDGPTDLPQATSVTPPAIDQGTKAAVFALHDTDASGQPAKSDTIVSATAVNGGADSVETVDTGMRVRQVMGAFNGRVVFNAIQKGNGEVVALVAMADKTSGVTTPWENLKTVTAVSPDETLLAGLPSRGNFEPGQRHCSLMIDAATKATIWTDCDWTPVEFSADGSRVLALPIPADGFGPTALAVLDAQTGAVVQEFRTHGTFARATFDGDADTVVAVVLEGRKSSIVRCSVDSPDCELTTLPQTVTPFEPVSLVQPYQLTAN